MKLGRIIYISLIVLCIMPYIEPPMALLLGFNFALIFGTPFPSFNKNASKYLLQIAVVGLGFGMNLHESLRAGADGILFTIFSVVTVLIIGIIAGRWFRVDKKTSYLIAGGTAICGGSAIAAISPAARANESQISLALGIVFILNFVALLIFPGLGKLFNMTQQQFGVWSAIAIHDTSSVVGAAAVYGVEALKVATTVKLMRALWIIPLSIFTGFYFKNKNDSTYIPWFIFLFVAAMIINTYIAMPVQLTESIMLIARQLMTLTLFFIGAGLSKAAIKSVGPNALVLGVILWIFIAVVSLLFVLFFY